MDDFKDKLQQKLDKLLPLQVDVSNKFSGFLNSIIMASSTIAGFALLALQIDTANASTFAMNRSLLIVGFIVLLLNTFFSICVNRFFIYNLSKPLISRQEYLIAIYKNYKIDKTDPNLVKEENKTEYEKNKAIVSSKDFMAEADLSDTRRELLSLFSIVALLFLFVGIMILVFAVIPESAHILDGFRDFLCKAFILVFI